MLEYVAGLDADGALRCFCGVSCFTGMQQAINKVGIQPPKILPLSCAFAVPKSLPPTCAFEIISLNTSRRLLPLAERLLFVLIRYKEWMEVTATARLYASWAYDIQAAVTFTFLHSISHPMTGR